jgi:iodotyrosine deiodinase
MSKANMIRYQHVAQQQADMLDAARAFYDQIKRRRTIREFSDQAVPVEIIEHALLAAGTAPSGANMQPWHFVVVSDKNTKRLIREYAEVEEREFYAHRASEEWLRALAPLGTDEHKPFLETAPYLIVVFAKKFSFDENGTRFKNYYTPESVGIATGMLLTALHTAGLVSLTHTPSPMKFLNKILNRPKDERPFLVVVTGYPAAAATVPDIKRLSLKEIATFI